MNLLRYLSLICKVFLFDLLVWWVFFKPINSERCCKLALDRNSVMCDIALLVALQII